MKKTSSRLFVFSAFALALIWGFSFSPAAQAQTIIKVGHTVTTNDPYHIGLVKMKEMIEANTEGRYKLDIYPNSQIGSERDLAEGIRLGSVGMTVVACAPVSNFVPELAAIELPFLLKDYEHVDRVFLGPIGQELADKVSKEARIKCLGFWEDGYTSISNTKRPINTVEDLAQLKIRTMENEIHQKTIKALGADPVPMAWGEAYTAMQQGAIDGVVQGISLVYSLKVGEICKNVAETNHIYSPAILLVNQRIWNKMTDADKAVFEKAAKEGNLANRAANREQCAAATANLERQNVVVTKPDPAPFRAATAGIQKELFGDKYADLIERIRNE